MIGIVIPAHNEEMYLDDCLHAARLAASDPALHGESVRIMVVLDSCTDASHAVVERHAALRKGDGCSIGHFCVSARNVGSARATGAELLLHEDASTPFWAQLTRVLDATAPVLVEVQALLLKLDPADQPG